MDTLKFVIVGHVDHGKSTLIGRIFYDTGAISSEKMEEIKKSSEEQGKDIEFAYFLDHLEEERQQGITIDMAQVFFKSEKRRYVIIDAPGHVEFVKNMVTGASQAEAALLIIDAEEGIKEQTKRHAYILSMLGITEVIVVFNKMDLVGFDKSRFDSLRKQTLDVLASIDIEPVHYIPISARDGDNVVNKSPRMDWYKGPDVLSALDSLKGIESSLAGSLVFPVQDVYKIDSKRIAVGRIEEGEIEKSRDIVILPARTSTKVKSIEKFLEKRDKAFKGESIGITTEDSVFIDRGNVICDKDVELLITDSFKANLFWMARDDFDKSRKITLRCSTQEVTCKVEAIHKRIDSSTIKVVEQNASGLKNLEAAEVTIKTKKPIVVKPFRETQALGRFVFVRDNNICAGGIITALNGGK